MNQPLFHVETRRRDGSWQTFTLEPIQGREAAEVHLASLLTFAKCDPKDARLHELTKEELEEKLVQEGLKDLSSDKKLEILKEYVRRNLVGNLAHETNPGEARPDETAKALSKAQSTRND